MIFETYFFDYFKGRIVDSHYPGLFMCIFSLRIALVYYSGKARCIQTFSKHFGIEKYGILKTNT